MRVIGTVAELQALADRERAAGVKIALVPTMGALHAGHLSLVDEARKRADRVWVSIFVNPTQFDDAADARRYPRTRERDLQCCRDAGVEVVFAPECDEMARPASQTWIEVGEVAQPLCGRSRPGHFRAVATIVAKLLLAAKPHLAVFGEKDYQQLAVIRSMVRDLGFDVEIIAAPIVRETDGLALSSRNVLLRLASAEIDKAPLARIDYIELRAADSLGPVAEKLEGSVLLALAVYFVSPGRVSPGRVSQGRVSQGRVSPEGDSPDRGAREAVRLIDNRVLDPRRAGAAR